MVTPNPLRNFHKFYNELLEELYDSMYDLVSPGQFKQYVVNQRAHRWKLLSAFDQTEKYHKELVEEGKSGYGINVKKYTQTELTGLTAQDVKRIENTIAELNRHMQKLNSHKLTVNSYRTNLFDTDIQIRIWKANELSFYDQLLKKYSEMGVEIEKKVSQMNVLGNNLKRKFSASNVLSEEEKRKKRRKIQNQIKSQTDKEKRNIASLL